jgi:hypothetical protein
VNEETAAHWGLSRQKKKNGAEIQNSTRLKQNLFVGLEILHDNEDQVRDKKIFNRITESPPKEENVKWHKN